MLGAVWANGLLTGSHSSRDVAASGEGGPFQSNGFEWSERVRDLAKRMRFFKSTCDETLNSVERDWWRKLFFKIYDSHDPLSASTLHEQVWRTWVRLELWRAAKDLATVSATKKERACWHTDASGMRRRLGISKLPPTTRSQMRAVVRALEDAG
jgi:hypothetical protein